MENNTEFKNLISLFEINGSPVSLEKYGNGHINDTYLLVTEKDGKRTRYIFQGINGNVFKNPGQIMENIEKVTAFLRKKNSGEKVMTLVPTVNGSFYYKDENGKFWRMYDFIENSVCLDRVDNVNDFYECAVAFGNFQRDLADFPADTLYETIPDFHNTEKRYNDFLNSVSNNASNRAQNAETEIEFVKNRADFCPLLFDAYKNGDLPLKVTHNDTKSNNVMLDAKTHKALCVIDLDTIMPGFSVTDFGDAVRFGASTAAEDEPDLDKVNFSLELYNAYLNGFLEGCGGMLSNEEIMLLPEGAKMMTLECGMRFLTDYIDGDTYFKTAYPEHNLVRARTQFKLVSDMENVWDELKTLSKKHCK